MAQLKDTILLKKIALMLKQIRQEKGLTQDEVFDATNIHIARIETGRANPSISTISTLCKYYNVKLSDFFRKVEEL
jgi:transcriptional regulator with XRE-family HTH domain